MKNPYSVVVTILITERSMDLAEENKYTFKVARGANKIDVKKAIEAIYDDVKVSAVNVMNRIGKRKRTGKTAIMGRRPAWKKAVVTLSEGSISIV
ncbi:MAG: 50S ribosomal protein L23 [Victivallales bacterium]|nr:50S ribosomal protein L23 [Victivallales bacterium]